jgi:hypothetical protein
VTHTEPLLQSSSVAASPLRAAVVWRRHVRDKANRLGARIVVALNAYADSCAAAALYEELYKLSDSELDRRGISRGDLHRWVSRT